MNLNSIIRTAFLGGYSTAEINIQTVLICAFFTLLLGAYIFTVYRLINRDAFYNRNLNISFVIISLITSAIILTIQSNIVVSLGMVGALSIVRFRTAIKDPMDLAFLFWSISVGIICGAGFTMIAIVISFIITIAILFMRRKTDDRGSVILAINTASYKDTDELLNVIKSKTQYMKVRARSATKNSMNIAIEVVTSDETALLDAVLALEDVRTASIAEHDGNIKG